MQSISDNVSEETIDLATKVGINVIDSIYHALEKSIKKVISESNMIRAGNNDVKKLIERRTNLKEIEISKDSIKLYNREFKKEKIPCAFVKDAEKYKLIFFEPHIEMVTKILERSVKNLIKDIDKEENSFENKQEYLKEQNNNPFQNPMKDLGEKTVDIEKGEIER